MLNTHFTVEHLGRLNAKGFINFTERQEFGAKYIEQSGGWQADTLTEDLT
ncbi:MAG: hypothetical protein R2769_08160 [Saprospiraceae bacterium]